MRLMLEVCDGLVILFLEPAVQNYNLKVDQMLK